MTDAQIICISKIDDQFRLKRSGGRIYVVTDITEKYIIAECQGTLYAFVKDRMVYFENKK